MSYYLLLRFVKLLAAMVLFAGSVGAVLPRRLEDRQRFAYWLAGPGFVLTWAAGFGLVYLLGHSLFSTWILGTLAASFLSLQGVLFAASKEERRGVGAALFVLLPLIGSLALMVWRP